MDFDTLKLSELEKVFGNELKDYYEDALREEAKEPLGYALDHFIDEVVSPDVNHKIVPTLHISKVELLEMNGHNESQINSHNTYWEELAQISNLIIEKNEFLNLTELKSYVNARLDAHYEYSQADFMLSDVIMNTDKHNQSEISIYKKEFFDSRDKYERICREPTRKIIVEALKNKAWVQFVDGKTFYEMDREKNNAAAAICSAAEKNDVDALSEIAHVLAKNIDRDCTLIPIPRSGDGGNYNLKLAVEILDLGYDNGTFKGDIAFPFIVNSDGKLELDGKTFRSTDFRDMVYFVDTEVNTGSTMKRAMELIPDARPLVFAYSADYLDEHEEEILRNNATFTLERFNEFLGTNYSSYTEMKHDAKVLLQGDGTVMYDTDYIADWLIDENIFQDLYEAYEGDYDKIDEVRERLSEKNVIEIALHGNTCINSKQYIETYGYPEENPSKTMTEKERQRKIEFLQGLSTMIEGNLKANHLESSLDNICRAANNILNSNLIDECDVVLFKKITDSYGCKTPEKVRDFFQKLHDGDFEKLVPAHAKGEIKINRGKEDPSMGI